MHLPFSVCGGRGWCADNRMKKKKFRGFSIATSFGVWCERVQFEFDSRPVIWFSSFFFSSFFCICLRLSIVTNKYPQIGVFAGDIHCACACAFIRYKFPLTLDSIWRFVIDTHRAENEWTIHTATMCWKIKQATISPHLCVCGIGDNRHGIVFRYQIFDTIGVRMYVFVRRRLVSKFMFCCNAAASNDRREKKMPTKKTSLHMIHLRTLSELFSFFLLCFSVIADCYCFDSVFFSLPIRFAHTLGDGA